MSYSQSQLIDCGYKAIVMKLKALHNKKVEVGFLNNSNDIAYIAFLNEFGHKARDGSSVPERPFMRDALKKYAESYRKETIHNIHSIILGALSVSSVLEHSGKFWKEKFKHSIIDFHSPGNAPATILKKGFDKPLVDTGKMTASVDYKVKGSL